MARQKCELERLERSGMRSLGHLWVVVREDRRRFWVLMTSKITTGPIHCLTGDYSIKPTSVSRGSEGAAA